ncbi:MAG: AAA family ATPase [Leptospiraceae bacterium]|nr:AAA family ATPase [Leptospiraceae bacterium]MCP5494424.1 AAA family ATPase [Leptospiraceae bacterium]
MKFKIRNLGIIGKAEIDLSKDLILLCGQNNTGKTFITYAIYGLLKSFKIEIMSCHP